MKIKRYTAGRTNVGSLAYAKGQIVSPGHMAGLAAEPFNQIADALGKTTDTVLVLKDAENKAIDAEDANKYDLNVAGTKDRMDRIAKQAKAENWSPERLVEANQKEIRDFLSSVGNLSERNRDRYAQQMGMIAESLAENTRLDANILRAQNARSTADTTLKLLENMGQFDEALSHIAKNRDMGVYSADEATAKALDTSQLKQAQEFDVAATQILDDYMDAYRTGNGDAFYARLINDESLPDDIKDAAVKKVENQQENFKAVEKQQAAQMKTYALADMTALEVAIKADQPLPFSIDSWASKYMGITDELDAQIMTWRKQLYVSAIKGVERDEGYQQFLMLRSSPEQGGYLKNSATNRKYLSREIAESTPQNATPEKQAEIHEMKVREAQFMDEGWETMFATATRSDERLAAIAPLWGRLMLDATISNNIDTEIDERTQEILTNTAQAIRDGIEPIEAAAQARDLDKLWDTDEQEMRARTEAYGSRNLNGKSVGVSEAQAAFKEVIDNSFDNSPWLNFNPQAFPQTYYSTIDPGQAGFSTENEQAEAFAHYERFYYDAKMRGATPEQAAQNANRQFTARFKMNNINGEWAIQKNGVDGDYNQVRLNFIDENSDEVVLYGDGGLQERPLKELDDITFQRPFTVAGDIIYEVWSGDGPLMRDVEVKLPDNRTTVRREIVIKRIGGKQLAEADIAKIREEADKRIDKYAREYLRGNASIKAGNIYGRADDYANVREFPGKVEAERRRQRRAEEDARRKYGVTNGD